MGARESGGKLSSGAGVQKVLAHLLFNIFHPCLQHINEHINYVYDIRIGIYCVYMKAHRNDIVSEVDIQSRVVSEVGYNVMSDVGLGT